MIIEIETIDTKTQKKQSWLVYPREAPRLTGTLKILSKGSIPFFDQLEAEIEAVRQWAWEDLLFVPRRLFKSNAFPIMVRGIPVQDFEFKVFIGIKGKAHPSVSSTGECTKELTIYQQKELLERFGEQIASQCTPDLLGRVIEAEINGLVGYAKVDIDRIKRQLAEIDEYTPKEK